MRRSILTEKLARRGYHVTREYSIDPFELARVGEVMDRNVPTVPATMKLSELSDRIAQGDPELSRRQGTLIVDEDDRLVGIITRGDIVRALRQNHALEMTVAEAGTTELSVAFPDEPLHAALTKMLTRDIGRLPVVERNNPALAVGYWPGSVALGPDASPRGGKYPSAKLIARQQRDWSHAGGFRAESEHRLVWPGELIKLSKNDHAVSVGMKMHRPYRRASNRWC